MIQRTSLPEQVRGMLNESIVVLQSPSVSTFERFERRGSMGVAALYIGIAALITGILGMISGPGGIITGVIAALINFFIFTGVVYYVGKQQGGTGTFGEVAYSFALFSAPLSVIAGVIGLVVTLLGFIPIVGAVVALLGGLLAIAVVLAQVYFAYLAVQSSMNLIDQTRVIITLGAAFIVTLLAQLALWVVL